ncbi:MAG: hypothetical protein II349_06810, partial [Akkermansia sp.]|nr:hypothetical protein [Akkermansia sp.]
MKLHLPVRLFRAVMALLLAAPSALYAAYTAPTTITIPSGYTQVTVDALADITAYSSTAQDVAFLLDAASLPDGMLTISGRSSSLMTSSAVSWYFTSYSASSLASLTFSEATTRLFYVSWESLQFTALQHLLFVGNTYSISSDAYGGAIDGYIITLSGNGSVSFSDNTASSSSYSAFGGAIFSSSTITLSGNGSVTFSGNTASGFSYARGGAIYGYDSTITLSGNESVSFSGNTASSSKGAAYGGAIYGDSITLSGNESVSFSGNT